MLLNTSSKAIKAAAARPAVSFLRSAPVLSARFASDDSGSEFRSSENYNSSNSNSNRYQNQNRDRQPRKDYMIQRYTPVPANTKPTHLLTLADLSVPQIVSVLQASLALKQVVKQGGQAAAIRSLEGRTIALLFSKRSTRTRVASETSARILGALPMFLGSADIQLGVNETLQDSSRVIGSMVDGMMARVDKHEHVAELAKYSPVPVINALCDLYHPTQILADLLTIYEACAPPIEINLSSNRTHTDVKKQVVQKADILSVFKGKKIAWVGDTNNIINEIMVTMPRLGMEVAVASPKGYDEVDERVWQRVVEAGTEGMITRTNSPEDALKDADIVVTDTWISMGQETEKAARLSAFKGYQLTNALIDAHAKPDWKFMHCLPRKQEEVDDEVFYGPRSLAFPEAENRKWTIGACFDLLYSRWKIPETLNSPRREYFESEEAKQ